MSEIKRFYAFSQNNSGGDFEVDKNLCHRLFIEAENAKTANDIAMGLGVYFNGCETGQDCDCCGDRWSEADESDFIDLTKLSKSYKDGFNSVESYAQRLANDFGWTVPDGRLFYKNGEIKDINTL